MQAQLDPSTGYRTITVTKASPNVGAYIGGVDIAAGVDDTQFEEIRRAFIEHSVIFFRDQFISPDQHIEWAQRWGDINVNRFFKAVDTHPQIAEVRKEPDQKKNIGTFWHTDHSYDQIPAMGSVLYAREVPDVGGDTLFASQYAAFEGLSEGMQQTLLRMNAHHSSRHAFGALAYLDEASRAGLGGRLGNAEAATQDALHPVVIRHPLSGRPALYVNHDFTVKFEGWTTEESQPLLDFLYDHASKLEYTCRFSWEPGSMAIWDNRAVHHKALNDYHGHRRLMHRITIEGVPLEAAAS